MRELPRPASPLQPSSGPLIQRGLEGFLRGLSAARSLSHPYPVREITPTIWLLSDAPRSRGVARISEVIVYGAGPEETVQTIRREAIGRHMLCVLLKSAETGDWTRDWYKEHGYRLVNRQAQFVLPLADRIDYTDYPVRRVKEKADAEAIAKAARGSQLPPEYLNAADAPIRLYGAFDRETPVGWASCVRAGPDCSWVSDLFVQPGYRRRGMGRSLMSAMLTEDEEYGAKYSVLLATKTGALLYPQLGYQQHGVLLIFYPPKDACIDVG